MEGLSPTLYPTAPSRPPTASPSPRLGFAPHPKLQSLLSQERVKLRTPKLASTFRGSIRTKAHKKIGEKGAWVDLGTAHFCKKKLEKREPGWIWGLPIFVYPLLSQEREKLRISNFASTLNSDPIIRTIVRQMFGKCSASRTNSYTFDSTWLPIPRNSIGLLAKLPLALSRTARLLREFHNIFMCL